MSYSNQRFCCRYPIDTDREMITTEGRRDEVVAKEDEVIAEVVLELSDTVEGEQDEP